MLIKKIPDTSGLATTSVLNTKFSAVQKKIPNTRSLVTTTVPNTKIGEVENKILDHAKYISTQEFHKLTAENFSAKPKQANLVRKIYFDKKLISFNRKISSNKTT